MRSLQKWSHFQHQKGISKLLICKLSCSKQLQKVQ
uniref:Uncharacterized protein n=1 Tax=Rhizophora mucronata TaxID=61149 RepID=A0A2P2PE74_RHIMU